MSRETFFKLNPKEQLQYVKLMRVIRTIKQWTK